MALVASVLVLFFLPYLHRSKFRGLSFRQLSKIFFWFFVGDFFLLT